MVDLLLEPLSTSPHPRRGGAVRHPGRPRPRREASHPRGWDGGGVSKEGGKAGAGRSRGRDSAQARPPPGHV